MSTNLVNDDELPDNDPTDELPVLLDVTGVADEQADDTSKLAALARAGNADRSADLADADGVDGSDARLRVAALERELDELAQRLLAAERELEDKRAAIAALDATLAETHRALEGAERTAAELRDTLVARDMEIDELHAELTAVRGERDAARATLAATPTPDQRLQRAQDEIAALAAYIENRKAHWDELEARCARQERRIAELELEVEQRLKRQRAAEEAAAHEMAQASAWRAELNAALRGRGAAGPDASDVADAAPTAVPEPQAAGTDPSLERMRRALTEAYAKLTEAGNDVARLERTLADRERALAARDAHVEELERELAARFAAPPAAGPQGADSMAARADSAAAAPRPEAGHGRTAELVVVNDPARRRYAIAGPVTTIGRSSSCDIQVLTQFVSREHARLVVDSEGVIVEDAGSTNGIFVNAARVERQLLAHGDLLTIGETQFRFLEAARP